MDILAQTFCLLGRFGTCTLRHCGHFDMWTLQQRDITAQGYFGIWTFWNDGHFGKWKFWHGGHFGMWKFWHSGRFGTWTFRNSGHFSTGIFWHWTLWHGFFQHISVQEFFDMEVSARGFFGTGRVGTDFFSTYQFGNFLTWTFRHVDISAQWTFRHSGHFGTGIFWHWSFSTGFCSTFFGISTFLTFKNFGTFGFTAKPPLLGRNTPLSLSHNPQSGKSCATVVFLISPASHHYHLTSFLQNQPIPLNLISYQ